MAKEKNLVPVFLTITLDSRSRPFQTITKDSKRLYTSFNKSFIFNNIETTIKSGYEHLQHFYIIYYKRCKAIVENLYFVQTYEPHKSLILQLQILFFVPKSESRLFGKSSLK